MCAATKTLLVLIGLAAASTACRPSPQEQNITTENSAAATTDIVALPPDESSATPTNELASVDDEASNVDQPSNTY